MCFDIDDGDMIFGISDDMGMDFDGHMMMRMGDNMAMDMDSGTIMAFILRGMMIITASVHRGAMTTIGKQTE